MRAIVWLGRRVHERAGHDLPPVPVAAVEKQLAQPGHGIDLGVHAAVEVGRRNFVDGFGEVLARLPPVDVAGSSPIG